MGARIFMPFVFAAGCAAQVGATEVADLKRRLVDAERQQAAAQHKLDELENRVFLLTDQVETQKVASLRRTPKPLVAAPRPLVEAAPPADEAADDDVVFEGEARSSDPDHARAWAGREPAAPSPKSAPLPGRRVDLARDAGDDNLGVKAAPPIKSAPPRAALPANEHRAPQEEPLVLYRAAYEHLRAGEHDAAARGFREFVRRFPRHDYADNAQYWLAECFYDQKRYHEAAPEFRAVVQRWPLGNKAPDALLKLGYSQLAVGEIKDGSATLREVSATYPRTEAARLAAARLTASRTETK